MSKIKVKFFIGKQGAKKAAANSYVCIVVDVLRASTTILTALENGFKKVKPVSRLSECVGPVTAGEKEGKKLLNLDYGNSPTELINSKKKAEMLILLSSNGTPCIINAGMSGLPVFIGCLRNCSSVAIAASHLAKQQQKNIAIVLAGYHNLPEEDDSLTGSLLLSKITLCQLTGDIKATPSIKNIKKTLLQSPAGKRLIGLGYKADIEFCSKLDASSAIPFYDPNKKYIEKYDGKLTPWENNYDPS